MFDMTIDDPMKATTATHQLLTRRSSSSMMQETGEKLRTAGLKTKQSGFGAVRDGRIVVAAAEGGAAMATRTTGEQEQRLG